MTSREFQVHGRRMKVCLKGAGPALLLVHGFPLDHTMWRHQIDYFSRRYTVIAPDLIGFGASEVDDREMVAMKEYADDLAELISLLNTDSPLTFCGLSMGGYVGWQLLKFHGPLIDRVIMSNTRSAPDDEKTARGRRLVAQQVLKHGVKEIAGHMPPRLLGQNSQQLTDELRDVISTTDPRTVAAAHLGMSQRPDMDWFLPNISKPTLLICGEKDIITPPREMEVCANKIPNAQFVIVKGSGHMTPLESPDRFNTAVESFLNHPW